MPSRLMSLLLLALSTLSAGIARAGPPPDIEGYRFYAFLNVTAEIEEPLPNLIRRELPEDPVIWPRVEQYVSREFPEAFTRPGSRILSRRAVIRLPMYRRPSDLAIAAPPPPPLPPPATIASDETIVGALIEADDPVARVGSGGQRASIRAVDNIRRGDTLSTTSRSAASVRLLDGTLILIRPDSAVLIKDFRFAHHDGNAGALNIQLVRGAMRTVSGMISKDPRSSYLLDTPGGSVTVRGTDYAVRWCAEKGACQLDGEDVEGGLYAGVLEGGIDLPNRSGASPANAGDIVHVASVGASAAAAPEMAPLVFTPPELLTLPKKPVAKPEPICRRGPRDSLSSADCHRR